jgi:hypothetical protein
VYFPPGTYIVAGLYQDDGVELYGTTGSVLKHPNGVSPAFMIRGRRTHTTGGIAKGASVVHVASTSRITPGTPLAIRGAGGGSLAQRTTLARPVTATAGPFLLSQTSGFPTNSIALLQVDDEIISYHGMGLNGLLNVGRGRMGTKPAAHAEGADIALLVYFYAVATDVSGYNVTIDKPATFSVANANVYVGTSAPVIRSLTLDANRPASSTKSIVTVAVDYMLVHNATITGSVIKNGWHGGISLVTGSSNSLVENNHLTNNGRPTDSIGSAVWLFQGATGNIVRNNVIDGVTNNGVEIDDRTQGPSEWDAPSDGNIIDGNTIDVAGVPFNTAVLVLGSDGTLVENNVTNGLRTGIAIEASRQGLRPLDAKHNVVTGNTLSNHRTGIEITGSDNSFGGNGITSTTYPIEDAGTNNTFS